MVGAGEEMEVGKSETAPGGTQHGKPCDAVHGMEQGAGEREKIEEFLAFGQMFDVDGAERDLFVTEQRNDLGKMRAGADEDRDTIFGTGCLGLGDAREMLFENLEDVERLLLLRIGDVCQGGATICGADHLRMNMQ